MKSIKSIVRNGVVLLLMVILVLIAPASALAEAEGPNIPAFGTNVTTIGTQPWVNPENITESGSPYATVVLYNKHTYSNYLRGTQYGFAIPAKCIHHRYRSQHQPHVQLTQPERSG